MTNHISIISATIHIIFCYTFDDNADVGGLSIMVGVLGPELRNVYEVSFFATFSNIRSSVVNKIV